MVAIGSWHAPPGYRLDTTDEIVRVESRLYPTPGGAERRAAALNAIRTAPAVEWRAQATDWAWRVVAYANRIVPIDPDYDALTLCAGCGDVPIPGGCGLRDCPSAGALA